MLTQFLLTEIAASKEAGCRGKFLLGLGHFEWLLVLWGDVCMLVERMP